MQNMPDSFGEIVTWLEKYDEWRETAQLSSNGFAVIERRRDGSCMVMIACNDSCQRVLLMDVFSSMSTARAWVEDKARMLYQGLPINVQAYRPLVTELERTV
jgi:hypothetical protein